MSSNPPSQARDAATRAKERERTIAHARTSLMAVLIGDRFGALFEGAEPAIIRARWPKRAQLLGLAPAAYTAVTEMSAALAASLVADPEFDCVDFGRRLVSGASPRRGYGEGTSRALASLKVDPTWLAAEAEVGGRGCYGNAAAARAVAAGLAGRDLDWLRWLAEESSGLTHGHAMASEGAVLVALAVGSALQSAGRTLEPEEFLDRLARECQMREFRERLKTAMGLLRKPFHAETVVTRLGNNSTTLGSVVTSLYCFAAFPNNFVDAVIAAGTLGGNASSLAAMTAAISAAYLGDEGLPPAWLAGTEKGAITAAGLGDLAEKIVVEAMASDR